MDWNKIIIENKISSPEVDFYKYQGLIDIIIPVYNDKKGLWETLFSLNIKAKYHIIIVDDCSTEDTYDEVIDFFSQFHEIELVKTEQNGGPAVAKNAGAKISKNKYIMFMDAGDTFTNSQVIIQIEKILEEHPYASILSCAHYEEGADVSLKYVPPEHNRWMGKVYNKTFFDKNGLVFNEDSSFCNDDIGMNMLARLIATEERIIHYDDAVITWHINQKSITRKNGYDYFYKQNNMGIAKSTVYALERAKKHFVHPQKIKELVYSVMCHMYYNCLSTLNYKPEFYEESLQGAKYLYDNGFLEYSFNMEMLVDIYNITTANRLKEENWEPALLNLPQISFKDFLTQLENLN